MAGTPSTVPVPQQTPQQVAEAVAAPVAALIPNASTFNSVWNNFFKVYSYRFDEAQYNYPTLAPNMLRDSFIRGKLNERAKGITVSNWQIVPADPDLKDDEYAKQLCKQQTRIIREFPHFLQVRDCLQKAVWFGRYAVQFTYGTNSRGERTYRSFQPIHGDKITFTYDGAPIIAINPMFLDQYPAEDVIRLPERSGFGLDLSKPKYADRVLIHQHEFEDADYYEPMKAGSIYGVGLRDQVFWLWFMRLNMLEDMLNAINKQATQGVWIARYDMSNPASKAQAQANLVAVNNGNGLAVPYSVDGRPGREPEIECIPPTTSGIDQIRSIIQDYFEQHITLLITGQSLSSGTEGSGLGGSGVAALHENTKRNLLLYDAANLDGTLTRQVRIMQSANGKPDDPELCYQTIIPDPSGLEKLQAAKLYQDMGGDDIDKDAVREYAGVPKAPAGQEPLKPISQGVDLPGKGGEPGIGEPESGKAEEAAAADDFAAKDELIAFSVEDSVGHLHSEADGKFVSGSDSNTSAPKPRPKEKFTSAQHEESASKIRKGVRLKMRRAVKMAVDGDPKSAMSMADDAYRRAVSTENSAFNKYFSSIKQFWSENRGEESVQSPEFEEFKDALKEMRDNAQEANYKSHHRAKDAIRTAADGKTKPEHKKAAIAGFLEDINEAHDEHHAAHHQNIQRLLAAIREMKAAFPAAHDVKNFARSDDLTALAAEEDVLTFACRRSNKVELVNHVLQSEILCFHAGAWVRCDEDLSPLPQ